MIRAPVVTGAWRAPAAAVLDFLLPRVCVACERAMGAAQPGLICGTCWLRVRGLPWPRCERCGHPGVRDGCAWCDLLPPFMRAVRSVCWMTVGTGPAIVHAFKYGGWTAAADGIAERMARLDWPQDVIDERCALVPVPLAPVRERERGFNQSALLAAALARRWAIPVWLDVLSRARATRTQTRLTPDQRRSNVAGAFCADAAARDRLAGSHIVLVDDVVTTGATLAQCATALCAGGARIVSAVTFGRAPALGDLL